MIKKIVLALAVIIQFVVSAAFAQSIADIATPKIVPPSPDAAALGKYGQIPVDKSTGIPSISIPLYDIKTPRFTLPISLSYHASGVKVDENASWVGLEWSLNAGGVVTRSIVGIPDESPNGYLNNVQSVLTPQALAANFHADSAFIEMVNSGLADSQPDNFFYNFAGHSGAFVFGVKGTPLLIPYKPLQITMNKTGNSSFTIVDESGNSYYFNNPELNYSSINNELSAATSWYLTQMVSADKSDTIKFYYTPPSSTNFTDAAFSFYENLGTYQGANGLSGTKATTNLNTSQQIYPDSIVFKGGKVNFISSGGRLDNGTLALDSVIISNYDYNLKTYKRLKSFRIITDYFHSTLSNPAGYNSTQAPYRLRLAALTENDQNNVAIKTHRFAYDTTVMLPPVHNFGQDNWGYYNGKYANQMLLQAQNIVSNYSYSATQGSLSAAPITYVIGDGNGANRGVSPANMQAGILQKITYPTGGSTVFTFEPHQYMPTYSDSTITLQSFAIGAYQGTSAIFFTAVAAMFNPNTPSGGPVQFHIHINGTQAGGYNNSTNYVEVINTSTQAVLASYYAENSTQDFYVSLTLAAGTKYEMLAVANGGTMSSNPTTLPQSSITTSYQVATTPVLTYVGGLRIKSIVNYDSNGAMLTTETYKYGAGQFLTNANIMTNVSGHSFIFGINEMASGTTYSNNSVYPLSTLNSSTVAYPQIIVYHGDTVNNIGISVYNYTLTPDSLLIWTTPQVIVPGAFLQSEVGVGIEGLKFIPRLWQNGDPVSESHYINSGNGVYTLEQSKQTTYQTFFRTGGSGTYIAFGYEFPKAPRNSFPNQYVTINDFIVYSYPISVGSRLPVYTTTTTETTDTVQYFYDNLTHMQPTRIQSFDGKGNTWLKQVKYPQDMVNANLDPTGIYAAMSAANIISPVIQFTESKNGTQEEQSVTSYSYSTPGIIKPQNVSLATLSNPAEVRLSYQKYGTNGNLLTVAKTNGPPASYIWGYNGEYPVAEVTNANANDVFYESFEDGNGNSTSGAKTGYYSHTGSYSRTLTGLDNGNYLLTYWQQSGAAWGLVSAPVTVSNSTGGASNGTYTISLNAQIDDIRFYPAGSQMVTYTYIPTVGVSSVTDAKNETTFYEYDQFERLLNIKDINGNIIKSFCYNYAGQATGCDIKPLPAPQPTTYGFTLTNSTGVSGFVAIFSGTAGTFNFNFLTSGSTVVQVPAGSYTVTVNPIGQTYRKFTLGARAPITAPGYGFSNVMVGPTNTETPLIISNP
jgi:YD repeat-containing protein